MYEKLQRKLREVLAEAMALANKRMVVALERGDEGKADKYRDALSVLEKLDIAMGVSLKPIAATSALSAEEFGKVSWALSLEDFNNPGARKKGSFGVWVRAMAREGHLPENHPGIEMAGALFGDALTKVGAEYEIRMFLGDDIPRMYEAMHEHLRSCMTSNGDLVELWGLNPDKVALVVAFRGDRPLARALLWREVEGQDEDGNHLTFSTLDRTYASEEGAREALKRWAYANGYGVRSEDDYYEFASGRWFELPDGTRIVRAQVYLKRNPNTPWPYADSFRYLLAYSQTDCYLGTHNEDAVGALDLTNGGFTRLNDEDDEDEYTYCEACGDRVHREDAYCSENGYGPYCESCYHDIYTTCERCGHEVRHEDAYIVEGDILCEDCYEEHTGHCDECEERFYIDNLVYLYLEDEDITLCNRCYNRHERSQYEHGEEVEVEG